MLNKTTYNSDNLKFYFLESQYFPEIVNNYHLNKRLSAFEFFAIISWKSNRPKPAIAKWLLENYETKNLDEAVLNFTGALYNIENQAKFTHLLKCNGIGLAVASAILSVLHEDDFTIYDYRVCETLTDFKKLANWDSNNEKLWDEYSKYVEAVRNLKPTEMSLRDKDRYLWGDSFRKQLEADIKNKFSK